MENGSRFRLADQYHTDRGDENEIYWQRRLDYTKYRTRQPAIYRRRQATWKRATRRWATWAEGSAGGGGGHRRRTLATREDYVGEMGKGETGEPVGEGKADEAGKVGEDDAGVRGRGRCGQRGPWVRVRATWGRDVGDVGEMWAAQTIGRRGRRGRGGGAGILAARLLDCHAVRVRGQLEGDVRGRRRAQGPCRSRFWVIAHRTVSSGTVWLTTPRPDVASVPSLAHAPTPALVPATMINLSGPNTSIGGSSGMTTSTSVWLDMTGDGETGESDANKGAAGDAGDTDEVKMGDEGETGENAPLSPSRPLEMGRARGLYTGGAGERRCGARHCGTRVVMTAHHGHIGGKSVPPRNGDDGAAGAWGGGGRGRKRRTVEWGTYRGEVWSQTSSGQEIEAKGAEYGLGRRRGLDVEDGEDEGRGRWHGRGLGRRWARWGAQESRTGDSPRQRGPQQLIEEAAGEVRVRVVLGDVAPGGKDGRTRKGRTWKTGSVDLSLDAALDPLCLAPVLAAPTPTLAPSSLMPPTEPSSREHNCSERPASPRRPLHPSRLRPAPRPYLYSHPRLVRLACLARLTPLVRLACIAHLARVTPDLTRLAPSCTVLHRLAPAWLASPIPLMLPTSVATSATPASCALLAPLRSGPSRHLVCQSRFSLVALLARCPSRSLPISLVAHLARCPSRSLLVPLSLPIPSASPVSPASHSRLASSIPPTSSSSPVSHPCVDMCLAPEWLRDPPRWPTLPASTSPSPPPTSRCSLLLDISTSKIAVYVLEDVQVRVNGSYALPLPASSEANYCYMGLAPRGIRCVYIILVTRKAVHYETTPEREFGIAKLRGRIEQLVEHVSVPGDDAKDQDRGRPRLTGKQKASWSAMPGALLCAASEWKLVIATGSAAARECGVPSSRRLLGHFFWSFRPSNTHTHSLDAHERVWILCKLRLWAGGPGSGGNVDSVDSKEQVWRGAGGAAYVDVAQRAHAFGPREMNAARAAILGRSDSSRPTLGQDTSAAQSQIERVTLVTHLHGGQDVTPPTPRPQNTAHTDRLQPRPPIENEIWDNGFDFCDQILPILESSDARANFAASEWAGRGARTPHEAAAPGRRSTSNVPTRTVSNSGAAAWH
ncbi:uncharacterized protein BXZ73DRAFT_77469 [Epithele typhae]|uniref:uncharacterized protein n=1 Tax=Epithele typhae TaxID=378194 RepID=UPI0020088625|nr:uncharacterized protein BXZ73DRAFT_77469 [Epithele typhae]KAH9932769.1 hypothetical protein BXZ73DRAFT_77469 [Epithele typhae]